MSTPDIDKLLRAVPDSEGEEPHLDDGIVLQYIRGQVTEKQTKAIEAHLAVCADCRALLVSLAEPVPPAVIERALASAPAAARPPWAPALVGGLIAAAIGAVFLVSGPSGPSPDFAAYEVEGPFGAVATNRGTSAPDDGPPRFAATSVLSLVFVTERPPAVPPAITLYVNEGQGELKRVDVEPYVDVDPSVGSIALEIPVAQLFSREPGPRSVHWVLHEATMSWPPTLADPAALAERAGGRDHQRVDVLYVGDQGEEIDEQ